MKNRIRELREERGLKQGELADAIGVRQNTLSTWETGRYEPDNEMLQKLAEYFEVTVDYLLGRTVYRTVPTGQADVRQYARISHIINSMYPWDLEATLQAGKDVLSGNSTTGAVLRVPVFRAIPAGIPLEAIEDVVDWEELPQSMAKGGKEYFALRVSGDSMWPEYLDGDVVIVRRAQTCTSGDVCVVYVNGYDATLKEVKLDEAAGTLTIVPRNPSYPPRTFTRQEIQELPVTIAGVVVELRRKIK